jgi:hypothetical protein
MQIAEAEAGVIGVARHAAGLALALEDHDPRDTETPELDRRREAGWSPADHRDVGAFAPHPVRLCRVVHVSPFAPDPASIPSTSAIEQPRASAKSAATVGPQ